jgi:hypothetical protein
MNTSKMNEIKAADANAGYGARGVPAFLCRFSVKWLSLSAAKGQHLTLFATLHLQMKLHLCIRLHYDPAKRQIQFNYFMKFK